MKTVFITGANRGIGLGLVGHYLAQNNRVIAAVRQPTQAKSLLRLQAQRSTLTLIELDLSSEQSLLALPSQLGKQTIDILFNNAGTSFDENLENWTFDKMLTSFTSNTIGPALVIKQLLPLIKPQGKIIQMSSGRASLDWNQSPEDGLDGYGASKAALNMFTRRLAAKLKPQNIITASISPGWVKTDTGGDQAPSSVSDAVASISKTADNLTLADSGMFFDENGTPIPW